MKRTLRHIFALLLVFAMVLPMTGLAWAADDVDEITLATGKNDKEVLYVRESTVDGNRYDKTTVTASIEPKGYDGTIIWKCSIPEAVDASLDFDKELKFDKSSKITLTAKPVEEETIVSLSAAASGVASTPIAFKVVPDKVETFKLSLKQSKLEIGGTTQATADAKYTSGDKAKVTFTSSDTAVAEVDKESGLITAKTVGSATITATAASGEKATAKLMVNPPTFEYTASIGKEFSLYDLHEDLTRKFNSVDFDKNDRVTFSKIDRDASGSLLLNGSDVSKKGCTFKQLSNVVFVTDSDKDFTFTVTVEHDDVEYSADVTITTKLSQIDIYIPVSGEDPYSFADKSVSGKTGYQIVMEAFSGFPDFKTDGSLVFEKTRSRVGTLELDGEDVSYLKFVNAEDVEDLCFVPEKDGTFTIDYSAYAEQNGKGTLIAEGTLSIWLNAASLDVEVNLDGDKPYVFSEKDADGKSANDKILEAVTGAIGKTSWDGIRFDTLNTSDESEEVGTLYRDSTSTQRRNELLPDDYIARAEVRDLYFVPNEGASGTYKVTFTVYQSDDVSGVLTTGTLAINVATELESVDFQYVITVGETLELDEDDFIEFMQKNLRGIQYTLAYITLDSASGGGTFYNDGTKFTPNGVTEFYSEDYDDIPRRASYINDLSFTAPKKAGMTTVKFTACCDRNRGEPTMVDGAFRIIYSVDDVPEITYNVASSDQTFSSTPFDEASFIEVYNSVTGNKTAKPKFSISILTLPATGYIYKDYDYLRGTGKALSASDLDSSYFTVNGTASKSVNILSYVAASTSTVSDTATYLAYDSNGTPLYKGTIRFVVTKPREETVSAEGLSFTASNFSNAGDPVVYVTFKTPSSGKFYVYDTDKKLLTPVTETTKLWVTDPTAGSKPVSQTHYFPKAGQTEAVTLTYTAYLKSGGSYDGQIIVKTTSRKVSSKFSDVKIDWAADAVDFASTYGLVQGTDTEKKEFTPTATMRRCDLILIFYRMAGSPAVTGTMPYDDVSSGTGSYAVEIYNSALWASQNGIVDGIVSGAKYLPRQDVTRQEYIRILYNYTKFKGISVAKRSSLDGFTDAAKVADYAKEAMEWAVANGYTVGTGNNKLDPEAATNRAQIVTFLHRYLTY